MNAVPNYPIEIEFPDISGYRAGNCGIPYLYSFDSGASGPHVMVNALTHGNEVCGAVIVIADEGHSEGRRMRDYGGFGDAVSAKNALLIECGQHWEASALAVAKDSTARFLALSGAMDREDLPSDWLMPTERASRVIRVTDAIVATSMDFRFAASYTGLEVFPNAGTVIAWRDGAPVTTPYDSCVLVMPSLRQLRAGVTVARLGRFVD